jgi:hypothetical protein
VSASPEDLVNDFGEGITFGENHYRAWVGPPEYYDRIGALQFRVLTQFGMREWHTLADVGCGSLRGGRLSIMYLRPGCYYGIEPVEWSLRDGIAAQLGEQFVAMKRPTFLNDDRYSLTEFGVTFDFISVHSVLVNAPASHIRRCLEQARACMNKKSIFIGTYFAGETDHVGDEFVYPRGVTQFRPSTIESMVTEAGLRCVHLDLDHPYGERWFLAVDAANDLDVAALSAGKVFDQETFLNDEGVPMMYRRREVHNRLNPGLVQD